MSDYGYKYENNFGDIRTITEIDEFAMKVISSVEPGFLINRNEKGELDLIILELGNYYSRLNYYLGQFDSNHVYSEHVKLFHDSCSALGIAYWSLVDDPRIFYPTCGKIGAELYNELLEKIRTVSRTTQFKQKLYARNYNSVRNYQSCVQYIDALFVRYSRLLVLRLDFSYLKMQCATFEEVRYDIEHFLSNRRSNSLFDNRVGYIIKLEYTAEKGPHFHCFFFLDGSKVHQDVYLAQEFGYYWIKLTEGRGIFFNCNMKKDQYEYCGVGMIHHADVQMRENLLRPIQYITKPEQSILMKSSPKTRVFWRGEMPGERTSNAGRPRKIAA